MTTETDKQFVERLIIEAVRLYGETAIPDEWNRLAALALRGAETQEAADDQASQIKRLEAEVERKDAVLRRVLTKYGYVLPVMVKETLTTALGESK